MRQLSENLFVFEDTCNVYVLRKGHQAILIDFGSGDVLDHLAEIGVEQVTDVLMTHHHRDQGQGLPRAVEAGIRIHVPHTEQDFFHSVDAHWQAREVYNNYNMRQDRFSILESVPVASTLQDYESRQFGGITVTVIPTPGHTIGSITLWATINGQNVAFTGDLIAAPGKVWSMSATQWSYNGAEGAAASIPSLLDLKDRQPDILLPSHGAPITEPSQAIDLLVDRFWQLLRLRGENPRLFQLREKPYEPITPHLLKHRASMANSYVLLSESGKAMFFDFGYDFITGIASGSDRASRRPWLYTIPALKQQFNVDKVDVVIPTHFHDDHVAGINLLRTVEGTEVWAADFFSDVLEKPECYDLPCIWYDPIPVDRRLPLDMPFQWEEYTLTLHALPGHTVYAVAISLEVDGKRVLVTGDQYQGNEGLELNYVYRNLYQTDDYVKSAALYKNLNPDLILTGHWEPFWVPPDYWDKIEKMGAELARLHRELFFDAPHLGEAGFIASLYPYQATASAGEPLKFEVEIHNPFDHPVEALMQITVPAGWQIPEAMPCVLPALAKDRFPFYLTPPDNFSSRRARIAVDVTLDGRRFGQQAEALISARGASLMRLSLNGSDWLFKGFYGEDWRWRDSHKPVTRDLRFWRQGSVPGSVHHDLWQAGEIPDPYFERNSLLLEWIPDRTWIYKKTFSFDAALQGKRIQLHFEGVDYEAEFFLNGESLGTHRGMYTPAIFEVSDHLLYGGENLIAVVIQPAPHEQPQVSRTSLVRTHKSRMTYWWDFCPRMIHIGIWDDVYLEVTDQVRIEDVFVRPQLSDNFQLAEIAISAELDALQQQNIEIEITLSRNENVVGTQRINHTAAPGRTHLDTTIKIDAPQLWFPNGYGNQPLYEAEIKVVGASTEKTVLFGVRKIEMVRNENSDPDALPYTFVVNGRKLYIKGWNWVPIDVMYGVPRPDKLQHLFTLAQRAHVNMLRIWGGGLIEKEAFYDLADRRGIMVWQEFIQSSSGIENNPSTDPAFIEMMVREAEQIIPRKRNHPSLVVWCGGNELSAGPEQPLDNSHPLLAALKEVVNRLDPDRFWLATSPTGRVFGNTLENIARDPTGLHDVHGPWEYQGVTGQYTLYNQSTSLLHSEFGVEGITNLKTLNATIAPEHQWPVSLENPYWFHLGSWWNKPPIWQETFGEMSDVETMVRATQYMQAEGLKYALESDRRRKYQNSGTLPWQFNEPYPMATCTSAVDYYGQAKPSYYAVAHAYEPIHVSAKFPTSAWADHNQFEAEIWVNNSHLTDFSDVRLQTRLIGLSGKTCAAWEETINFAANDGRQVFSVNSPFDLLNEEIFFLDLNLSKEQQILSQNRYIFTRTANLAPLLNATPTHLTIEKLAQDDKWKLTLTNHGNAAALFIWIEDTRSVGASGYVYFEDNHFCLFPGETRTVSVLWRDIDPAERHLEVRGWNFERIVL